MRRIFSSLLAAVVVGALTLLAPASPALAADVAHNTKSVYLTGYPNGSMAAVCIEKRIYLSPGGYDWGVHATNSSGLPGYYSAVNIGLGNGWYRWKHCIEPQDGGTYTHRGWLDPDNPDWGTATFSSPGWRIVSGTYTIGSFLDPELGTPSPAYPDRPGSDGKALNVSGEGWYLAPTASQNRASLGMGCRSDNWVNMHPTWKVSGWTSTSVYVHTLVVHIMPGRNMTTNGGQWSDGYFQFSYADVTTEGYKMVYTINRRINLTNGSLYFIQQITPGIYPAESGTCGLDGNVYFYLSRV